MKKLLLILSVMFIFSSCVTSRGYEHVTKNYIGYGTYKAPNKKGLDK